MSTQIYRGNSIKYLFLVIAAVSAVMSCAGSEDRGVLLEGLPPELAVLLAEGEDSTLRHYIRENGLESALSAKKHFEALARDLSGEEYIQYEDSLYSLQRRLCKAIAEEYDYDFFLNDLEFLRTLPPKECRDIMNARADLWGIPNDKGVAFEVKYDSIIGYYDMMIGKDDIYGTGIANMALYYIYNAEGKWGAAKHYLIEARDDFSEVGFHQLTCQALGNMGNIYRGEGKVDSMDMCFEKVRELAMQHQMANQVSRINYFYAIRYGQMGRTALALDLLNEAIELCRQYKGGQLEVRYIYHAMEAYAEFSCWETVERLLARAKVLQRIYEGQEYSEKFDLGIKSIEAQLLMTRGDVFRANNLYREIEGTARDYSGLINLHRCMHQWAEGLLDNGFAEEAVEVVDRTLNEPEQSMISIVEGIYLAIKARAEFEMENYEEALKTIERFELLFSGDREPRRIDVIMCDVIRARVALARGDDNEAFVHMQEGLKHLWSSAENVDASVQAYLWVGYSRDLHSLMHELTAHDPRLRYGAELFWRNLTLQFGANLKDRSEHSAAAMDSQGRAALEDSTGGVRALTDYFKVLAESAMSELGKLGAVQLMYIEHDEKITRIMASAGEVDCAVIPVARDRLQDLIGETYGYMAGEAGDGGPGALAEVRENLALLGRHLLPEDLPDLAGPDSLRMLLVSNDGLIGRIPFETLDIGSGKKYVPLLEEFDVAYLRHFENRNFKRRIHKPGLIIINSSCEKSSRTIDPFARDLEHIKEEGLAAAALDESAVILQGSEVTKQEIGKRWEDASYIYFATHILRDPEMPYLMLIPLAAPDRPSLESGYLDFSDIRSADFSACGLVVLSGCSSGAPSISRRNFGPSLGDAFLDAGAGAVITTFWDVKDREAMELMSLYAAERETGDASSVRALCSAKRKLFREKPDPLESFDWASYSINIGNLSGM